MATKTKPKKQQKSKIAERKKRHNKLHQRKSAIEKAIILNEQGADLIESGQYEVAIEKFKQALQLDPNNFNALYNYGVVLANLGQHEAVIENFKWALQLHPNDSDILYNYGVALGKLGQYEAAIEKYAQVLQLHPNKFQALALYNYGLALVDLGQYEAAIEKYEQALQLHPNNSNVLNNYGVALGNLGQYEAAIEKYAQALQFDPNNFNALYNYGGALAKLGQDEDAIEKFKQALQLEPNNSDILYNYGVALGNLGQHEAAIEKYAQVLQLHPNKFQALALHNYGLALVDLGQYEAAIEKYEQALQLDPNNSNVLNNYGVALGSLGQYEAEIEKYEQALQFDPNNFNALYNYGSALGNLGQDEAAIEKYAQALQLDPNSSNVLNNYGVALGNLGQYEAAIEKYVQALQFDPNDFQAWYNYGVALGNLGQYEAAIEKYEQALQIKPNDLDALHNYGLALVFLGKYQPAIEKFEQALAISHSQNYVNWLYLILGSLYYRIRKEQQGNTYFQSAIEHSSDKDAARLQAARDILAAKPYSKEGVAILKDIVTTSPQYAEAFKMLKLNVEPEEFFEMFYDNSGEELHDSETLHRAIYHKMLNEIFILKNILYRINRHYQNDGSILQTAIESIEEIQVGVNAKRDAAKRLDREVMQDNYRTRMEIISKTAQEVADFVNNGFFRLKAELQRVQRHVPPEDPFAAQLTELIARLEQSENALNDLKSLREGITIRRSTFKIKQLFETWQAVPQFQQATIRLDIRNSENEFYGDAQKIRSFINELVENAVKHNPAQPDLQIEIASHDELNPLMPNQTVPHDEPYLVIQVRDNGKGVPPDKKEWIFLPLKSTAQQGSGLGLAIIQRTVRKMDGYITETGTDGADFHIYLPYHKET